MRLRFAPSPTGSLHIGGLRTALFNFLISSKLGGSLILRIEDTDRKRYQAGAIDSLINSLTWSGITFNEGPHIGGPFGSYIQSERLSLYRNAIEQLLESNAAYRDYASPGHPVKTCDQHLHKPHVVRFKLPQSDTHFTDTVYGDITFPSSKHPQMGFTNDPILLKSDGFPTYHLASVVDDTHMQISHVLRGEEWLSSMPIHLALYKALEHPPPNFAHLPLLINPDGSKLSKRSGDVSVDTYQANQWEPEALINFTALMGWNALRTADPINPSDFLSIQSLIDRFDLRDVPHRRAAMFTGKLQFLNKQHLGKKVEQGDKGVLDRFRAMLDLHLFVDGFQFDDEYLLHVLILIKDRINNLSEAAQMGDYFFVEPLYNSLDAKLAYDSTTKDNIDAVLKAVSNALHNLQDWQTDTLNSHLKHQQKLLNLKTNEFMMPLRWALTGKKMGPSIAPTMQLLGKERTLHRLLK
ncbi:hypothetical protein E3P77_00175 [Wallemia ichthyophaga]|nr:hypothetical protein E3P77_00175 [Wallemia ichthyophaga]